MCHSGVTFTLAGALLLAAARELPGDPPPPEGAVTTQPSASELLQEIRLLRDEMRQQEQRHQQEMRALQSQIDELKKNNAPASTQPGPVTSAPAGNPEDELENAIATSGGGAPAAAANRPGGGAFSLPTGVQSFNPDISVNGDFLGAYSSQGGIDEKLLFRELEIGLSAAVDPYTTANAIVTVGRENGEFKADLEEAYLTFNQLPYGLQARAGEFRAEFGKTNPVHLHALPWIDYPLVIKRYFGEEGLSGMGGELSWLVPHTGKQYIGLTYEIVDNNNDSLFAGQKSQDFTHLLHLKTFRDLSPTSNLEFGASFATGVNDEKHAGKRSTIEGLDVTYHWKPKDPGLYRALLLQAELLAAQVDERGGQERTFGGYAAGDYQFAKQWKIGLRYDYAQLPFRSSNRETGYSVYVTFLQSEFVFWRLGYLFIDRNFRDEGNADDQQFFLQLNWTYGVHPAHRF